MDMTNYNWIDIGVIVVLALSILVGLWRGLIREVIALLTWILAFVVATIFAEPLASKFTGVVNGNSESVSYLALGISFVCIFIGILILGRILSYILSSAAETGGVGLGNRILGAFFGFVRGILIVLIIMFLTQMSSYVDQPEWKQSKFVSLFAPAIKWMDDKIQPQMKAFESKAAETWESVSTQFQGNVSGVPNKQPTPENKQSTPVKHHNHNKNTASF